MKKLIALFLSALMLLSALPFGVFAEEAHNHEEAAPTLSDVKAEATSGTTGSCTWTLDGTVLTISGNGKMGDYSYSSSPWGTSITEVTILDGVTSIGKYAFSGCTGLTSVTIGNSVTSIGDDAFYSCDSLITITIPDSVTSIGFYAFPYCTSLTSITIPDSVTSIGSCAFYKCTGLTSITIGNSVTSIGPSAFEGCTGLTSITIGNSVTSIGNHAFYNCTALRSITIPDSVTSIGYAAFEFCSSLTTVTIPDSVTSIGDSAFEGCTGLTSITIGNSVTSIGDSAFYGCTGLTSIVIPDSVTSIGSSAFSRCSSLTTITIPDSVTSIGDSAFYDCSSLTTITIPDSVTSIADFAFSGCSSLTTITIPDGVTSIGENAFEGCSSLTTITIPDGVTSIGSFAFYYCTGLTDLTIPDSVTSIGDCAFDGCKYLKNVWYLGSRSSLSGISIGEGNGSLTSATWHYLDSRCDEACNVCDALYPNAHTFDHPCDPDCNACGKMRTTEHDFGTPCGETCKKCNETRVPDTDHTYRNVADATCDVCGKTRSLPFDAYGTTGACDWYVEGTVLTVVGSGAMGDYSPFSPSLWSKEITELRIENGVSVLGEDALSGCTALTTVTIPQTVTKISDYAFDGCTALAHVWLIGDEATKNLITLGSGNTALTNALWHYVDAACDGECNECGAIREATDHVYDSDYDTVCNVCGEEREPLAFVAAALSVAVEERMYLSLWLDGEGVDLYKSNTGKEFTYEVYVTVDGERISLGSGKVERKHASSHGYDYHVRLSALPANYFDKVITVESPVFTINTVEDQPLTILNLAKAGVNEWERFNAEYANLFKAIYNYGASAAGLELLDMGFGFLREQAADPIYGVRTHDAVRFTGMQLLMGDAVGIRLLGKVTGDISGLSLGLNLDGVAVENPTYVQNVDEEGNLTLDLYVGAENYLSLLDLTVSVDDYAVLRLKTSVKGYTEWANKGTDDRTLALAQLVQACINYYADESTLVIPGHTGVENPSEAGEIIF